MRTGISSHFNRSQMHQEWGLSIMRKYRIIALWMERIASVGMIITLLSMYLFQCSVTVVLVLGAFSVILLTVSLVISLLFWRCTNCGKGFPIHYGIVDKGEICPYCGEKIE